AGGLENAKSVTEAPRRRVHLDLSRHQREDAVDPDRKAIIVFERHGARLDVEAKCAFDVTVNSYLPAHEQTADDAVVARRRMRLREGQVGESDVRVVQIGCRGQTHEIGKDVVDSYEGIGAVLALQLPAYLVGEFRQEHILD